MTTPSTTSAAVLGAFLFAGLVALALIVGNAALDVKAHERSVQVKGLAEREVPADVVIWPLSYQLASNNLNELYESIAEKNDIVTRFLADTGLDLADASLAAPAVVDRHRKPRGSTAEIEHRCVASANITLYA